MQLWPNMSLRENYRGREWDYTPFVEIAHKLLSVVHESSGVGYRFTHVYRVFQAVAQMRYYPELAGEEINWPLVRIAALLHDVGVTVLARRYGFLDVTNPEIFRAWVEEHASLAPDIIRAEVRDLLSEDEVDEVCRLSALHMDYRQDNDLALKVLQDADNVDERGMIFMWRMNGFSHNHGRTMLDQLNWYFELRPKFLAETTEKLYFPSSHVVATQRTQAFDDSMMQFWQQMNGVDIPFTEHTFPWERWEKIIREKGYEIDRPIGSRHPRYEYIVYPVDYGFIPGVMGWDDMEQDIFVGSPEGPLVGIILTADFHKGDREFKLLWGLTPKQVKEVHEFFNREPKIMTGRLVCRRKGV